MTVAAAALAAMLALFLAPDAARADDPDFVTFAVGWFDAADDDDAIDFRLEYRSNLRLWVLKPFAGLSGTTESAFYLYGGFGVDLFFGRRWVLYPNVAVGLYEDGDGKDLGHTIEFRSGVELAYRFDDRSRLGFGVHHISNASLGDRNPGTNLLVVTYSVPFSKFSRR